MKLRRLVVVFALAAFIAAIPLSNVVLAQHMGSKTTICHFPNGKEIGRIISVASIALDTHITMHGDLTRFGTLGPKGNQCEKICKILKCGRGEIFDTKLCKCVKDKCPPYHPVCDKNEHYDTNLCRCVPDDCLKQDCKQGEVWDAKLCKCVPAK